MPTGISIHVGLNSVDPDHYGGWDGKLKACEDDASDMAALAEARGLRIAVFWDSCHSASVTGELVRTVKPDALAETLDVDGDPEGRMKAVPDYVQRETYESHKRLYDEIQDGVPPIRDAQVGSSV